MTFYKLGSILNEDAYLKYLICDYNKVSETVYEIHGKVNFWFYVNHAFYGSMWLEVPTS
jgi:hypothetical protein